MYTYTLLNSGIPLGDAVVHSHLALLKVVAMPPLSHPNPYIQGQATKLETYTAVPWI